MKRLLPFLFLIVYSCVALRANIRHCTRHGGRHNANSARGSACAVLRSRRSGCSFPKTGTGDGREFDLAPPHNEIDPNLCAANAGNYGGVNAQCNAFARYQLSGTIEIRPIGRTIARRLNFFFDPNFLFGKNVPQTLYTWSWDGIGMEYKWGVGIDLPKRFEFRFTQHPNIARFGSRDQPLGPAWLGPNGPWGQYNTIGIRKYFGTRREGTD